MRRQHTLLLALGSVLAGATAGAAQEQAAQQPQAAVVEAVLTTEVMDRQPVDNVTSVDSEVGRVYLWTRIAGADHEQEIEHVWYHGGQEMARVPLHIAGSNWRTWSSKNIEPSWTGEWRVDVVAADGTVLDSVAFTCG